MPNCEFGLYMFKGRARTISDPSSTQLTNLAHRDETDHPTEKPVPLMEHWIRQCSAAGDLVLDPFMGTGSCAVAAVKTGRRFVGVELNPKYFATACARVERAVAQQQGSLFA
jgi:site-specific DNA-methyltransferase (adenine-specific)